MVYNQEDTTEGHGMCEELTGQAFRRAQGQGARNKDRKRDIRPSQAVLALKSTS